MAIPPSLSAKVTADLDLSEIKLVLGLQQPPTLELKGRLVTKDRTTGRFSEVVVTLHHIPPSCRAFIEDMKAVMSAKTKAADGGAKQPQE